jgi:protein TonB
MLAYAAGRPRNGERRSSPNALLVIISAHIAAVAVLMSAKMDLPSHIPDGPTIVQLIRQQVPPRPVPAPKTHPTQQTPVTAYTPAPPKPNAAPTGETPSANPPLPLPGASGELTQVPQLPTDFGASPVPVSTPAQPLTAASDLKPPYPQAKLLAGEEATLTLRLTVDELGHVVAVDAIGRADPVFLAAARRHLIARWRYKPAMQDGRAVASTVVVTLRFELDD